MAEKRKNSNNAKEDIINRVYVLYGIFILLGLIIAVRLVWIQVADKSVEQHIEVMKKNIGMRRFTRNMLRGVSLGMYMWLKTTSIMVRPLSASIYPIRFVCAIFAIS